MIKWIEKRYTDAAASLEESKTFFRASALVANWGRVRVAADWVRRNERRLWFWGKVLRIVRWRGWWQ